MKHGRKLAAIAVAALAAGVALKTWADPGVVIPMKPKAKPGVRKAPAKTGGKFLPASRLVPVAETRLLMEGLAAANFHGLENILRKKPKDLENWVFARGQALLIAETGNLLMLRPPRNKGEKAWQDRAADLRTSATQLARLMAKRDYEKGRKALESLANRCNACHKTFRVKTRIVPFAEREEAEEE
jgi:hypothetical protein